MEKREYRIKFHSIFRVIFAMISILIPITILMVDKFPKPDSEIISIAQFLVVYVFSFYLAYLIGMGRAKIVFTKEGIHHIWERRFLLNWSKNYFIPWSLVDSYVFQVDRTFDNFIINLNNKTRYKVSRLNIIPIKDDFNQLVTDFPKLSNDYKNGLDSEPGINSVKKGKSIYESKSFRWVFYFLFACFLFLVLTKVFNPDSGTTWISLFVIGFALLFYGKMILAHKRTF